MGEGRRKDMGELRRGKEEERWVRGQVVRGLEGEK